MDLPPCTDRLSALPDDILVSILEKLGRARETVGACVLSRRWAKLPLQLPAPEISITEFLPGGTRLHEVRAGQLGRAMESFRGAVSSFLSVAETTATTRCLRLDFLLADGCTSILQRRRRRKQAHRQRPALRDQDDRARDGLRRGPDAPVRATLPRIHGRFVPRHVPPAHEAGAEQPLDRQLLLSACPRLERLELRHCYRLREELAVDAPAALRELVLYMCFYTRVVLRSAPNLTRLVCDMWMAVGAPLSLLGVPRLEALSLANPKAPVAKEFRMSELLTNVTSLRHLSLDFEGQEVWIQPEPPRSLRAAFCKLSVLSVGGINVQRHLSWTMFFLKPRHSFGNFASRSRSISAIQRTITRKRNTSRPSAGNSQISATLIWRICRVNISKER
ncbi:hypothetical protein PR202_ga10694 [Eleusine coracana subsp. coracana]|uniref:F-box/LRR-repeat protein 15/At3g58940/PEG3-like LRR domain-containing protein n=1 Tax=Eleusine coracana subsp. coracana TaxID=191504 RepID=A0AAV5C7F4_ELECO|nr:hypothetical protein PR202_ga10694 [Eleusine coracana subsp. coracana]